MHVIFTYIWFVFTVNAGIDIPYIDHWPYVVGFQACISWQVLSLHPGYDNKSAVSEAKAVSKATEVVDVRIDRWMFSCLTRNILA